MHVQYICFHEVRMYVCILGLCNNVLMCVMIGLGLHWEFPFIQDITMLEFCLHLIEMHLPATPATMATNGKTPVHRADQLE